MLSPCPWSKIDRWRNSLFAGGRSRGRTLCPAPGPVRRVEQGWVESAVRAVSRGLSHKNALEAHQNGGLSFGCYDLFLSTIDSVFSLENVLRNVFKNINRARQQEEYFCNKISSFYCANTRLVSCFGYSHCYAPINVKPAGGWGRAWGGDLTFFKNLPSNSLPTGKLFKSNAQKFPHPRRHIARTPIVRIGKKIDFVSLYPRLLQYHNI